MLTTVAFSEAQDSAVLANVAALADQHVRVSGDDIIVPRAVPNIVGVYFLGLNFTLGQVASPSLRRRVNLDIEPGDRLALPLATTKSYLDYSRSPIPLDPEEALNALAAEDGVGAIRTTAGIWLADGPLSPITGDIVTVRATSATALVANVWSNVALTFTQTLPAGRWQVVGFRAQSANMQLARLVFVDGAWRPGVIGTNADNDSDVPIFRRGGVGSFGEFSHNTPPTVDCLANAADATQVFHLDLIKVG